jgi:hypothetical protein
MSGATNIIPVPFRGVNTVPDGSVLVGQGASKGLALPLQKPLNIVIAPATTTNANDSIKITGAAAALSPTNPGYIPVMNSAMNGRITLFKLTADVTILLTGAHFGEDTYGDLTDAFFRVVAINDTEVLKFGVMKGKFDPFSSSSLASATHASVNAPDMILVNSALNSGNWPSVELGGFAASFDDTGGAAENLWAVTAAICTASADGFWTDFNTKVAGFSVAPTWTALRVAYYGKMANVIADKNANGTSNGVSFTFDLPFKAKRVQTFFLSEMVNNGAAVVGAGLIQTRANSRTCDLYFNGSLAGWNAANGKSASFSLSGVEVA